MDNIKEIANRLVSFDKGILAADASVNTMNKRFKAVDVEETEEMRRQYRELLLTTGGIEDYLNGVILFDETIRQNTSDGTPLVEVVKHKEIIPGIKVDSGTVDLLGSPGEKITEGLEGLNARLKEYFGMGARFAKWRAVIAIGDSIPTDVAIRENAKVLAKYALACHEEGLVPMVEPEVLLDGTHSIERAEEVVIKTLNIVFDELKNAQVDISGVLLKSSMVLPGKDSGQIKTPEEIAEATIRAFKQSVPDELPGIVFLSGGQNPKEATLNLNAIKKLGLQPWKLTFSYSRALQEPVLEAWKGESEHTVKAQEFFLKRLKLNQLALKGEYDPVMEL